ncbi:MAG TPA: hypothetical protein VKH81_22360 [Candidatus Angelobacter sp.]|nr:hypothetical protein [Candidatus Angelobacter sp.]
MIAHFCQHLTAIFIGKTSGSYRIGLLNKQAMRASNFCILFAVAKIELPRRHDPETSTGWHSTGRTALSGEIFPASG